VFLAREKEHKYIVALKVCLLPDSGVFLGNVPHPLSTFTA
jgi:hypothetical protein